ncbi:MAG: outer membrane protein assembly factor BamE [Hyphomonadaceae bacterium]
MQGRFLRMSAAALAIATLSGCITPISTYSGYRPERNNEEIPDPQPGVDTQATVRERFGSPSTTAIFDQTTWYYVSQVQEQTAFFNPETTQRQVMAVRFDGETVAGVEKYGLERGQVVDYASQTTPTRGRELGLLEQLFGNIGQSPPLRNEEDEQGSRRDR